MARLLGRIAMALVGLAVLALYTAGALGGVLVLRWLLADPPGVWAVATGLLVAILLATYVGYRLGTVRLVTALDATRLDQRRAPAVHRRLARLAGTMDVRHPPVLVADLGAPNALSIGGPRTGVVVLDRQLLRLLTIDELEGILAHELAHMEAYDTVVNTLVVTTIRTLSGAVALALFPLVLFLYGIDRAVAWVTGRPATRQFGLADAFQFGMALVLGVAFSVLTLWYLSYSRKREYAADARAAEATGKPAALARALVKIHRAQNPRHSLLSMLYIHEDEDEEATRWLSTHPPIEERVDRLLERVDHPTHTHQIGRIRP